MTTLEKFVLSQCMRKTFWFRVVVIRQFLIFTFSVDFFGCLEKLARNSNTTCFYSIFKSPCRFLCIWKVSWSSKLCTQKFWTFSLRSKILFTGSFQLFWEKDFLKDGKTFMNIAYNSELLCPSECWKCRKPFVGRKW